MFQLTPEEAQCLKNIGNARSARRRIQQDQTVNNLRSQSATSSSQVPEISREYETSDYGGRRSLPYCFTEQGVAMLSAVLKSQRAIAVSIEIVRTFVKLREMLSSNVELARRLTAIEEKYDEQFKVIFDAIRELTIAPNPSKGRIGF